MPLPPARGLGSPLNDGVPPLAGGAKPRPPPKDRLPLSKDKRTQDAAKAGGPQVERRGAKATGKDREKTKDKSKAKKGGKEQGQVQPKQGQAKAKAKSKSVQWQKPQQNQMQLSQLPSVQPSIGEDAFKPRVQKDTPYTKCLRCLYRIMAGFFFAAYLALVGFLGLVYWQARLRVKESETSPACRRTRCLETDLCVEDHGGDAYATWCEPGGASVRNNMQVYAIGLIGLVGVPALVGIPCTLSYVCQRVCGDNQSRQSRITDVQKGQRLSSQGVKVGSVEGLDMEIGPNSDLSGEELVARDQAIRDGRIEMVDCQVCNGRGKTFNRFDDLVTCAVCEGKGKKGKVLAGPKRKAKSGWLSKRSAQKEKLPVVHEEAEDPREQLPSRFGWFMGRFHRRREQQKSMGSDDGNAAGKVVDDLDGIFQQPAKELPQEFDTDLGDMGDEGVRPLQPPVAPAPVPEDDDDDGLGLFFARRADAPLAPPQPDDGIAPPDDNSSVFLDGIFGKPKPALLQASPAPPPEEAEDLDDIFHRPKIKPKAKPAPAPAPPPKKERERHQGMPSMPSGTAGLARTEGLQVPDSFEATYGASASLVQSEATGRSVVSEGLSMLFAATKGGHARVPTASADDMEEAAPFITSDLEDDEPQKVRDVEGEGSMASGSKVPSGPPSSGSGSGSDEEDGEDEGAPEMPYFNFFDFALSVVQELRMDRKKPREEDSFCLFDTEPDVQSEISLQSGDSFTTMPTTVFEELFHRPLS